MDTFNHFSDIIGDIDAGRNELGGLVPLSILRVMMVSLKETLAEEYGSESQKELMRRAGKKMGIVFGGRLIEKGLPRNSFLEQLGARLLEWKFGIVRIEKVSDDFKDITLSISEDIYCSGLPILGDVVCDFEEGFLEGIFNIYFEKEYMAREVDCWATGHRVCRFRVIEIGNQ